MSCCTQSRCAARPGGQGMTLDNLLALVALACCPDAPAGLSEQLYGLTRAMATQPDASAELRALAGELTILCLPGVPAELKDPDKLPDDLIS